MSRPNPTVEKCLKTHLKRGGKYLIAVSGGIDSICLLHACSLISQFLRAEFHVAHLDHGLRESSAEDAAFVAESARSYGFPIHLQEHTGAPAGQNVEQWGRETRYAYFLKILTQEHLDAVLTAHTASDVAETLLMRLLSNKEPRGILRFDPVRKCLRPLLDVPRHEIQSFVEQQGLEFREDPTNADINFLRNRIRHRLIPVLQEQFDERIEEVLSMRGMALSEDQSLLDELARNALAEIPGEFGSREWMQALTARLEDCSEALQWRIVEQVLKVKLGFNLGRIHSFRALRLFLNGERAVELPSGMRLQRQNGGLLVAGT